jgi:hypothetical protein
MSANGTPGLADSQSRSFQEKWVALTADAPAGVLGQSRDSNTRNEAETSAMNDCASQGGTQCKVVISARNGCISMALSPESYGTGSGPTVAFANASAVHQCIQGGGKKCDIIYEKCVKATIL